MKTILLITTSYPSTSDGSEAAGSFVQDFAEELARSARVLVLAPGETSGAEAATSPVQVYRYRGAGRPLSLLKVANPLHWPAIIGVLRAGARETERLLQTHAVDHILALWVLPCGAWAARLQRRYGVGFSTWALGSDIWTLGRIPLVRTVLRRVLRASTTNFADGLQLCADVETLSGRPCTFLPSTRSFPLVPATNRDVTDAGCRLAFLGRWHPNKGTDLLLQALELLTAADWQRISEVRIHGGGPLQQLVQTRVAALAAAGRPVTVGGYLDKAGAARLFGWCDFVVIPSRIESIPVVFSDAMKAGKPVITTPVGDLGRLIDSYSCGLATGDASAAAIAAAIQQALQCDYSRFLAGVARAATDFSLPAITASFLNSLPARS